MEKDVCYKMKKKNNNNENVVSSETAKKFSNKKYMMHKYWGKKPAKELRKIILEYTKENELLFDPFAGYGGFSSEALLTGRNVISNDLNPISNFINKRLLSTDINFKKIDVFLKKIEEETKSLRNYWYGLDTEDGRAEVITALRKKNGQVVRFKIIIGDKKKQEEYPLNELESIAFKEKEDSFTISDWFPTNKIITNSRISAKEGLSVPDLFDIRSLSCHSKLYKIINSFPDCEEKNLLLFAFTSNIANCSKLVPPIRSRGEMSQGAWMTGFYVGETYLENNVFHYFHNRVKKIISGKKEYLEQYSDTYESVDYKITNEDAKNLSISEQEIDFVFTDFPYGDAVPYFEQSIIWNSWLKFDVDYKNEIVISDSKIRQKDINDFSKGIFASISEIYRVLKRNKFFVFTYHSLSGFEWSTITNSLLEVGFEIIDCELIVQKTFTPRQLNRKKTIKGDLLVVCKKTDIHKEVHIFAEKELEDDFIKNIFLETINDGFYETNEIIVEFLKRFFRERVITKNSNIISMIEKVAIFDGKGWVINNNEKI